MENYFEKVGDDLFLHHLVGTCDDGSPAPEPIRCTRMPRLLEFVLTYLEIHEVEARGGYTVEHSVRLGGIKPNDSLRDIREWNFEEGVAAGLRIKTSAAARSFSIIHIEDGGTRYVTWWPNGIYVVLQPSEKADDCGIGRISYLNEEIFTTQQNYMIVEISMPSDLLEDLARRAFELPWSELTITLEMPLLVHEFDEGRTPISDEGRTPISDVIFEKDAPVSVRCVSLRRVDYVKPWRSGAVFIEKATDEPSRVSEKPSPLMIDADSALKSSLDACAEALRTNTAKRTTVAEALQANTA